MDKFTALYEYLLNKESDESIVNAWNTFQEQNPTHVKIYLNSSKNILGLFHSSADLADVLTFPSRYDRKDKYFTLVGKNLYSFNHPKDECPGLFLPILVEWILENGDQGMNFIEIDDYLEDEFINEWFGDKADDARVVIDEVSKDEPIDFLMEDWGDIAANMFFDVIVPAANNKR